MPDFKHVGTIEILVSRIYNIDPYVPDGEVATTAIVEPGVFPLMFDGYSHVWVMKGVLNGQFLRRGDGMFIAAKEANAMPTNIHVEFPSKLFGPDDWQELVGDPICQEGDPEQRLRITIIDNE